MLLLQNEEELVGSTSIAVEDLFPGAVGALTFSGQHKVGLILCKVPPLEVTFPGTHFLSLVKELVLLEDLLLNVTYLGEVLSLLWLQGVFVAFMLY